MNTPRIESRGLYIATISNIENVMITMLQVQQALQDIIMQNSVFHDHRCWYCAFFTFRISYKRWKFWQGRMNVPCCYPRPRADPIEIYAASWNRLIYQSLDMGAGLEHAALPCILSTVHRIYIKSISTAHSCFTPQQEIFLGPICIAFWTETGVYPISTYIRCCLVQVKQ